MGPAVRFLRAPSTSFQGTSTPSGWSGVIGPLPELAPRQKLLHIVRHAQGFHNVDPDIMRSPAGIDARLTDEGFAQCARLAHTLAHLRPEVIVTSPLTRTIQTALHSFPTQLRNHGVPLVALEAVRETVNYMCDVRRPLSTISGEIAQEGVAIDLSGCTDDHDEIWATSERKHGSASAFQGHRESVDPHRIAARARGAFEWLAARPEREIVIVTHSAFLWHVLNMERVNHAAGVPAVVDYGGDLELDGWLSPRFENAECRSVICEFLE